MSGPSNQPEMMKAGWVLKSTVQWRVSARPDVELTGWMRRIHTELYKSPVLKYCDVLQKRLHSELAYCWMVKTWSQSLNFDKTIPNQDPLISFFQCFQSRSSSEDGVCKVLMDMEQLTGELRSCHDFMQSTCLDFSSVLGQNLRTKVHSWVCK